VKHSGQRWWFSLVLVAGLGLATGACSSATVGGEEAAATNSPLCSSARVTSDHPNLSATPGETVVWTASPSCTGTPEYQFWLRSPSGTTTLGQDWSTANSFNWNTTSLQTGTWELQVWIRDVPGGNYQVYASSYFTLSASQPCTSLNSSITPSSGTAGTVAQITNSASPCSAAEYLVAHQPPGGSWSIDSNYSAANSSYSWNTLNAAPGLHQFQIWVRRQGSTQSYEAYRSLSYVVLAATPCTAATISVSPANHASVGTPVTLSSTASGCGSAQFRYFYKPLGGATQQLQGYTSSPTATWNTTLATPGVYEFQVWTRATGSTADYEAYTSTYYTLDATTPTHALSIGGGWEHNCSLLTNGKVACWGYNAYGQLGNASTTSSLTPVAVSGITQGVSLSSGFYHSCAAVLGGAVRCWGNNTNGQLGNSTYVDSSTPVSVTSITSATQVAAGNSHTCAVLADRSVRCWGYNTQGQLGNGTKIGSNAPVAVAGITTATQVAAGYYHSCALLADRTVKCWGQGTLAQLGDGTSTNSLTPVTVTGLTQVTALSTDSGNNCALKSDGTIWCWGANSSFGSLGSGSTTAQPSPVQVPGVTTATSVAVGPYHGCASLSDGSAVCWGANTYGELGNASNTDSLVPVHVSNLSNVATVGISDYTSCATLTNNTLSCWGYNYFGALGNGLTAASNIPVAVSATP